MLTRKEIMQTLDMIDQQHLDIRTITMGISLLSCCDPDPEEACRRIYDKICRHAERLVATGEADRAGIWHSHRQQADLGHAHGPGGRGQRDGGLRALRQSHGPGCQDLRRQLHRRLLRLGPQGHDRRGPEADRLHSRGPGGDRLGLFLRQRRLHTGGHQHGRRPAHGPRS